MNLIVDWTIKMLAGGALVFAAIATGLFNRKKIGAETRQLNTTADDTTIKSLQGQIEFHIKQADNFRKLYEEEHTRANTLMELYQKEKADFAKKIKQLEDRCQHLEEMVAQLSAHTN